MRSAMMAEMYRQVEANEGFVYLVVATGLEMPYLEEPFYPDENSELPDEECSNLSVFTSLEGAQDYMRFCIEARDVPRSSLKVIKLHMGDLWNLIEEMEQFANHDHEALFKIYLVWAYSGEQVQARDCIYMQGGVPS